MNIVLITEGEIRDREVALADHRAAHIRKVLRASVGDRVRIGVINGRKGSGTITAIGKGGSAPVCLLVDLDREPPPLPEIDIILALPRPIMLRRILTQIAAMGIGTLFITHANRVEKSFWDSGLFDDKGYLEYLRQGLEQAGDTRMPEVQIFRRFRPFVEDFLPQTTDGYQSLIIAHPYGGAHLVDCLSPDPGRVLLAVGPEGGWVDFEVEKFTSLGFCRCSFGERILKVDTAVVALHAGISAIRQMQRQGR
jgi:RsmE family RNA methyltransferase